MIRCIRAARGFCNFIEYTVTTHALGSVGHGVRFDDGIYFNFPKNIFIGDNVFIGRSVYLNAHAEIEIGSDTIIGASCKIISANHVHASRSVPIRKQGYDRKEIIIGNNVWLGYNVVILPGVRLGDGCIVAAGSIVNKSFEDYSIIAGVPARKVGSRD